MIYLFIKCRRLIKRAPQINNTNATPKEITQSACSFLNVNSMYMLISQLIFRQLRQKSLNFSKLNLPLPSLYVTKNIRIPYTE